MATAGLVAHRWRRLADGGPLDSLCGTLRDLCGRAWRVEQDAVTSLLAFEATNIGEAIPQTFGKSSEFGVPMAAQAEDSLFYGFGFRDFDLATRHAWTWLRDDVRQSTVCAHA